MQTARQGLSDLELTRKWLILGEIRHHQTPIRQMDWLVEIHHFFPPDG